MSGFVPDQPDLGTEGDGRVARKPPAEQLDDPPVQLEPDDVASPAAARKQVRAATTR
jgi:hypothetical protein